MNCVKRSILFSISKSKVPCFLRSKYGWKGSSNSDVRELRLQLAGWNRCTLGSQRLQFSSKASFPNGLVDLRDFDIVSDETLESLSEKFEEILERNSEIQDSDVSLSDGVLTVKLGDKYGTYVINKQTPNRQIWLSSPVSGPMRFDFMNDLWIYKREDLCLHKLLNEELKRIAEEKNAFDSCAYSFNPKDQS